MNNIKPNLIDFNNLVKLKNIGLEPTKVIV